MLKAVYKLGKSLGKGLVQMAGLATMFTASSIKTLSANYLYVLKRTADAQAPGRYAQPNPSILNLLILNLCPVSTGPITNTKLIKELSL
jgi:hypothetical protein